MKNIKIYAVLLGGGSGSRMNLGYEKQLLPIGSKAMIVKTFDILAENDNIDNVLLVAPQDREVFYKELICSQSQNSQKLIDVIGGGKERSYSSFKALKYISEIATEKDIIIFHDGARPFLDVKILQNIIDCAIEKGNGICCVKPKDTIRTKEDTLKRDELYLVQTPQAFLIGDILKAFEKNKDRLGDFSDEASLFETLGKKVEIVSGSYENIKVTTKEDIKMTFRIGKGYDVHKIQEGLDCILGGVKIENDKGMIAHSDGDVLTHAIMDSLLGAVALGDIGRHFPDTDPRYKGISSIKLLEHVYELVKSKGYEIENIDATIICERPKISPYVEQMKENICSVLNIEKDCINIKGTTTEKLGFNGRSEGITSEAVCLLRNRV